MSGQQTVQQTPREAAADKDARFFFTVLKHCKTKPDTDWDAVAAELGYANKGVAQVRFGQIKRKLGITTNDKATPDVKNKVTKSTPKTGSAKAKQSAAKIKKQKEEEQAMKKEEEEDLEKEEYYDDDDMADPITPTPKRPGKLRSMKNEDEV
ncbi:hypothetical protein PFICI_09360 [Pestalotiopsis fici W106-1]|uniref:Myb-like DNA-binding domain-containing protein n=1 Tax=Pestalotiopsis fici (strain W106-1 / CGMCC3.15140) TaxID=1229662 RepID=W3X293_PESFW|nr:uncharacterized protein PFICI_09360 [Pestalotiopsis fici W106-1]ETS79507.1 hypothetical protein PFICI_09360 [Pestalotiopsis fici W106-1]